MRLRGSAALGGLVLLACVAAYALAFVIFAATGVATSEAMWPLAVQLGSFLAFPVVGSLIVSQRPSNTVGWLFCAIGLGTATTAFSAGYVQHALAAHADAQFATGLVDVIGNVVWPLNLGLGTLLLLLFPNGKPPSPRWHIVLWPAVTAMAAEAVSSGLRPGPLEQNGLVMNPLGIAGAGRLMEALQSLGQSLLVPLVLAAIASLIVRYRRAAGVQRQQIKWFVYGAALMALTIAASIILAAMLTLSGQDPSNSVISTVGFSLGFVMLPVGAGIGVLRYRLYDIDFLINRTLVYGIVTVLLAAVYWGCVIASQSVLRGVTGQRSSVTIVASTFAIAGLFQPLRFRVQSAVDRRFYRAKYNTVRTLEHFAATLRNEVDLADLSEPLVAVVEETMQPAQVSLWLREPEPQKVSLG